MNGEVLERAAQLRRRHRPFVIATVVWARGPSSGKQGSTALIERGRVVHGWIGGACAQPVVLREAMRSLDDGEARLLYLGPADELDGHTRPGVVAVPIACGSEGAMEVFMEPVLPQPHVVVVGRSPAVSALVAMLGALDWRVSVVADEGGASDHPAADAFVTSIDEMRSLEIDHHTAVVVATQGHYDEPAVEAALATDAWYVGLVASARRAGTVIGYLQDRGASNEVLSRIHAPAGLDLGPVEHSEIAAAIVAELVALRAAREMPAGPGQPAEAETATDPVCGMAVGIAGARFLSQHAGETYYFCAPGCQAAFERAPAGFVAG